MIRGVLDELKKRSVVRVAGLYAVAGWAVFQVVNAMFPALGMSPWTVSAAALLFLAGFPVAVALAWMFEITPEGVKRVPRDRRRFGAGPFGWIDWLIAAVVVAVFGFSIVQLANLRDDGGQRLGSAFAGAPAKSVAVLPFASFSELPADGFFADGLTEELINSLAQSPELKVAGRTSSFYFKGRNQDLREVGRKLGVAHVVEGSVRRAGERLRVTAQLISVKDGFHLWSRTYDRDVDDALAIQTEVAEAVADNLKAKLTGKAEPAAGSNPDDYRAALIARAQLRTQDVDELKAARAAFAGLRQRDPNSASAHAGYAQATILLAQNYLALPFDEARREAGAAIARALEADPRSADAWRAKGAFERVLMIRTGEGSHHRESLAAFRKAYELDPRDPETMTLLAKQFIGEKQTAHAIGLLRNALATDPLSRTTQETLADALAAEGRFDEARRTFETLLSLYPDYTSGASTFALMLMSKQGRLDDVVRLLDDPKMTAEDPFNAILLASSLANLGMHDSAIEAIDRIPADSPARPIGHAAELQLQGRSAELLSLALEQGRKTGDPIWSSVQVAGTTLMGEYGSARAAIPSNFPGALKDPPDVAGYRELDVLLAATALQRTGSEEQAKRVLESLLRRIDGQSFLAADQLAMRGMVLAALGRRDDAVAAFDRAEKAGWRMPIDLDYFVRIEKYPFMAEVSRDPRFRRILARIEADLTRMRENVLRWRQPGRKAA